MKVDVVDEGGESVARLRRRPDFQSGAQMDFAYFDLMLEEAADGVAGFFELHREMAGVVIDAEMFGQPWVVPMLGAHTIEKMKDFAGGFEQAGGFRLEAEVQFAPGLRGDPSD